VSSRAEAAHALEQSAEQAEYQASIKAAIGPHVNQAMKACADKAESRPPEPFVLVADIRPDGSLSDIDVDPSNAFSDCFARQISGISVPPVPNTYSAGSYPIALDVHFH
jgi:hypothetical protein